VSTLGSGVLTKRERMLAAMTGGVPDRVPASPDTNWMIPVRLLGVPFWQVYYYHDPPLWKAYNDCVRYFGIDGFSHHGYPQVPGHPEAGDSSEIVSQSGERMVVRHRFRCPAGELTSETTFLHDQAPTATLKPITDLEAQFDCLQYMMGDPSKARFDAYKKVQADMGEDGVVGLCMDLPMLMWQMRQPAEAAFYDYYDHHDLVAEWMRMRTEWLVGVAEQIIAQDVRPDFVFFPNSGMITMQSVEIMKEFSLPALKTLTRMFKQAGIVTSQHCCGKERALVEVCATETDLDCIDPLEVPPMGDCNLREIKGKFGRRLALKGNLHTTQVMLRMDADGVERAARQCLDDAMEGGGFVLSTGDQCGRDTPDENITRLVEVCEKYGTY
jgi:uroporphyrinogen decarboxylase